MNSPETKLFFYQDCWFSGKLNSLENIVFAKHWQHAPSRNRSIIIVEQHIISWLQKGRAFARFHLGTPDRSVYSCTRRLMVAIMGSYNFVALATMPSHPGAPFYRYHHGWHSFCWHMLQEGSLSHRSTTTQDSGDVHEWASVALASYYK